MKYDNHTAEAEVAAQTIPSMRYLQTSHIGSALGCSIHRKCYLLG